MWYGHIGHIIWRKIYGCSMCSLSLVPSTSFCAISIMLNCRSTMHFCCLKVKKWKREATRHCRLDLVANQIHWAWSLLVNYYFLLLQSRATRHYSRLYLTTVDWPGIHSPTGLSEILVGGTRAYTVHTHCIHDWWITINYECYLKVFFFKKKEFWATQLCSA